MFWLKTHKIKKLLFQENTFKYMYVYIRIYIFEKDFQIYKLK